MCRPPRKDERSVVGHLDVKEKGKAGYDQGPDGRGLENVEGLGPKEDRRRNVEPKAEKRRAREKDPPRARSSDLDPHRNEFEEVDIGFGMGDCQRRGEEGTDHDQQVKERVDHDENLPVFLDHAYNLL
jgi:hypothetical protein